MPVPGLYYNPYAQSRIDHTGAQLILSGQAKPVSTVEQPYGYEQHMQYGASHMSSISVELSDRVRQLDVGSSISLLATPAAHKVNHSHSELAY